MLRGSAHYFLTLLYKNAGPMFGVLYLLGW